MLSRLVLIFLVILLSEDVLTPSLCFSCSLRIRKRDFFEALSKEWHLDCFRFVFIAKLVCIQPPNIFRSTLTGVLSAAKSYLTGILKKTMFYFVKRITGKNTDRHANTVQRCANLS